MSLTRLAVGTVALCFAVAIGIAVNRQWDSPAPPHPDEAAERVVRNPEIPDKVRSTEARAGHRRAEPSSPENLAPSEPKTRRQMDDPGGGSDQPKEAIVLPPNVDRNEHQDLVREMPAAHDDDTTAEVDDDPELAGLPDGTRFAAALSGNTTAADGSEPIVEKNTNHDDTDGVYFPPDAQLAYANRAGVDGDAGTLAVWVEPVDWDGKDASVHSLFRLNDPSDGGYRFHLLKDSTNLRLQFITENGENDIQVPIDWWPRGESHHVAATWDRNVLRLYVDGVPLSQAAYRGTLQVPADVPGWWGSKAENGTPGAGAVLKDTLVAGRPFDEAEMQRLWGED